MRLLHRGRRVNIKIVQYYRFQSIFDIWHYIAANSKEAALRVHEIIGSSPLERITRKEAERAPGFEEFARKRKPLSPNGVYLLGVVVREQ